MRLVAAVSAGVFGACVVVTGAVLAQWSAPAPEAVTLAPAAKPPVVVSEHARPAPSAGVLTTTSVIGAPAVTPALAHVTPTLMAQAAQKAAPSPPLAQAQAAASVPSTAPSCPGNSNALGVTRVVEIDTMGGPGFGSSISRSTTSCAKAR
jgi:hypothetical protein